MSDGTPDVTNTMTGGGGGVQAHTVHGGVTFHQKAQPARVRVVGRGVPLASARWAPRQEDLDVLASAVVRAKGYSGDAGYPVVAVTGPEGVGKTQLVAHWLRQWATQYPDGLTVVCADCGPNLLPDGTQLPTSPADILNDWLVGLGHARVADDAVLDCWRVRSDEHRPLVAVVDDVENPAQVHWFCNNDLTVVTSRNKLTGLSGHSRTPGVQFVRYEDGWVLDK